MIGLHGVAVIAAFAAGGLVTLWSSSDMPEDREVFGWSGFGASAIAILAFGAALVLR